MSDLCAVARCGRPRTERDWCHAHFERQRRGDALGGPILDTPMKRFEDKYLPDPITGCWLWTAATDGGCRYGAFYDRVTKKVVRAHRWIYEQTIGPIPEGLTLDHLCRTTLCVNPYHMEPVTHRINVLRGESLQAANARKTHCKRGHKFTPENTLRRGPGGRHRQCRTCARVSMRAASRRYWAKKKALRASASEYGDTVRGAA